MGTVTNNRIPFRDTCRAKSQDECMDLRKFWKSPEECSSIYGGFKANENNLHNMVMYHLEDSFKFLLMASHFNRDDVNRVGLHKTLMGYSDQLWANALKMIQAMHKHNDTHFDPSIFGFFQDDFVESYTQNIRELAGHLNIMGKMAKDEKTKKMGLHLFDTSL